MGDPLAPGLPAQAPAPGASQCTRPRQQLGEYRPAYTQPALDRHVGEWVAIKDGKVIAHGPNARHVVQQMRQLPAEQSRGAVLQRSARPTEALAIGLG